MKRTLFFFLLIFFSKLVYCQQMTYQYQVVPPDPSYTTYGGQSLGTFLNTQGSAGWKLVTILSNYTVYLVKESAADIRPAIEESLRKLKADLEEKIDRIAAQKADDATKALRLQLVDAMKDAKLYDQEYKNAIIDAALVRFKTELDDSIKNLKKELKP